MPPMSAGFTFAFFSTALVALHVASHQSSGSCSLQPGLGEAIGCSAVAVARTLPFSSQTSVLVPLVPMSMPSKWAMRGSIFAQMTKRLLIVVVLAVFAFAANVRAGDDTCLMFAARNIAKGGGN